MPGMPMKRRSLDILADVERDDDLWESLLGDVIEGKPWRKVLAKRLHEDRLVTWGAMLQWIESNPERVKVLDQAERFATGASIDDTIEIADNIFEDPASRKVRIEARWRKASKVDRAKWGEKDGVSGGVTVVVQRGAGEVAIQAGGTTLTLPAESVETV